MPESNALSRLTPRERRCLELVALHYDTGQIATELGISVTTVNGYLSDARQKLGARNRKEAVRILTSGGPVDGGDLPPSDVGGMFGRVEEASADETPPVVQLKTEPAAIPQQRRGFGQVLYFDRPYHPNQFGRGARLGMIVALVVAFALAMALAVIAVVGLVSISTSLRS